MLHAYALFRGDYYESNPIWDMVGLFCSEKAAMDHAELYVTENPPADGGEWISAGWTNGGITFIDPNNMFIKSLLFSVLAISIHSSGDVITSLRAKRPTIRAALCSVEVNDA